jgi:hypothetical protein
VPAVAVRNRTGLRGGRRHAAVGRSDCHSCRIVHARVHPRLRSRRPAGGAALRPVGGVPAVAVRNGAALRGGRRKKVGA